MMYKRLALYYAPRPSELSRAMAGWLGWDPETGTEAALLAGTPVVDCRITAPAAKYGFHGTLKAPFRLRDGRTADEVQEAVARIAALLPPVVLDGMVLARIGGFLALVPEGNPAKVAALAETVVRGLDRFRAPLTDAEIARRDPRRLTVRQEKYLNIWGYPYVMEEFRFHLTLTGEVDPDQAEALAAELRPWLEPILPRPFVIEDLCLFGEGEDGRFHLVSRHALTG